MQTYTVRKITKDSKGRTVVRTVGSNLLTPPNNVGPASTPNYDSLVAPAIHGFKDGTKVFAGQRDDPFFVDLGWHVRPAELPQRAPRGVHDRRHRRPQGLLGEHDRHPGADHTAHAHQERPDRPRQHQLGGRRLRDGLAAGDRPQEGLGALAAGLPPGEPTRQRGHHPAGQEGPLEPQRPADDKQFEKYYLKPELAGVVNLLYDLGSPTTGRIDLTTILLKGIPPKNGLGLPTTQIGNKPVTADLARINLAAPPTAFADQTRGGLLDGQLDGHPNGRRLVDDTVNIAERAVAGVLAPAFGLPAANGSNAALVPLLGDGVNANDVPFLTTFPYVATPGSGFASVPHS